MFLRHFRGGETGTLVAAMILVKVLLFFIGLAQARKINTRNSPRPNPKSPSGYFPRPKPKTALAKQQAVILLLGLMKMDTVLIIL